MIPYNALNDYNSKVTVELRDVVESGIKVWDFDYPSFYTGEEKTTFEQKVIDHFYFRQIGHETVGRWLHCFRSRVREIMPYYIQMYKSVELFESIPDPLESYNLTEEYKRDHSANGKVNGKTTDQSTTETETDTVENEDSVTSTDRDATRKFSNTPQGSISNIDNYMTEATTEQEGSDQTVEGTRSTESSGSATVNASGSTETTSEDQGTESYKLTRRGNIGVQPLGQELNVLRSSFINVDMMVINELNDLFLRVY